ncbi:extracellular solute-binding protein [Paenibacillus donghaensis]|uniref:extracellular solute-binding protein n=1 Tax=Paenibacillus donghaensis TaxID=414771 RepID=UPI001FE52D91|nr:extracellular solute-binding protein [Paenibacillus donghaensis]
MSTKSAKLISTVLSLTLGLSLLAGCGGEANNNSSSKPAEGAAGNEIVDGKYKEPVKIKVARQLTADVTFRSGEDINNNPHKTWAKDKFNIDLDYVWTADSSSIDTKIRLMLSANEALPDVIQFRGSQDVADALIDSGKFLAINDLFEQYAGDSLKSALAEDPTVWNPYTRDG